MERGAAGLGLERERAVVAVDDDPSRGGEAEPRARADVLGGEERVEHAVAVLRRDARAVVADLDDRAAVVAPRGDRDRAVLAERVDRVVEQVGPHLVELGAAHAELGQRAVVLAHDLDRRVLELVAEHLERRLQPLVQVDLDHAATVHVRVLLDGADEVGHPPRRLLQLAREALRRERCGHPADARRRTPARRQQRRVRATPRRGRRPRAARRSATPRRRRAPAGGRAAPPRHRRRRACRAASGRPPRRAPRAAARRASRRPRARSPPRRSGPSPSPRCRARRRAVPRHAGRRPPGC